MDAKEAARTAFAVSVREGSTPQKVPDFTRGAWEAREPLGIESLDPAKMDLGGIRPMKKA